jgi:hypothetical protein
VAFPPVTAVVFPKTTPGARLLRSGAIQFCGWAWMVFAALNLADLIWRGRDVASLVAAAVMLLGSGIAYTVALRPRILADAESVRLYNLLRDVRVPWDAVQRIEGGEAVYVHSGDRRYRAFVLQTAPRARAKAELKARRQDHGLPDAVADYVKGRTATDFAVEQLRELAEEHSREQRSAGDAPSATGPAVTWAWPAVIALALPGALTVAAIVAALV